MTLGGVYLRFGEGLDEETNRKVQAKLKAALARLHPAVTDLIPGYASLFVEYDARRARRGEILAWLEHLPAPEEEEGEEVTIPVRYDGPDLEALARWAGLSPEEVIRLHSQRPYRVFALGFSPGFPFLAKVDEKIAKPRLPEPRSRVPALSVGIAGLQTGVYPTESPGGWNLIGRALVRVFDPHRERPFLVEPGDRVRFVPEEGPVVAPPEPLELLPPDPEDPVLEVLEAGLADLVVDRGRFLAGRFGLARSGPADPYAALVANRLVKNPPGAPVLELNLKGPCLRALAPATLAFAGFGLAAYKNDAPIPPWSSFSVAPGDELCFEPKGRGSRAYLAVAGGFFARTFWQSASPDPRGKIGRPLRTGDRLGRARPQAALPGRAFRPPYTPQGEVRLRLLPGPQATREALRALTGSSFVVEAADRVGVRLEGAAVPGGEVTSEAVPLGAVQVPPGGRPILLLADRGTLGGYAKPALLHPFDLKRAAQLRPGDRVRFVLDSSR